MEIKYKRNLEAISPDYVCHNFNSKIKNINLNIRMIDDDMILIEGEKNALEFLSELFKACSTLDEDDGFQISPTGAGQNFFNKKSKFGLYINKI